MLQTYHRTVIEFQAAPPTIAVGEKASNHAGRHEMPRKRGHILFLLLNSQESTIYSVHAPPPLPLVLAVLRLCVTAPDVSAG